MADTGIKIHRATGHFFNKRFCCCCCAKFVELYKTFQRCHCYVSNFSPLSKGLKSAKTSAKIWPNHNCHVISHKVKIVPFLAKVSLGLKACQECPWNNAQDSPQVISAFFILLGQLLGSFRHFWSKDQNRTSWRTSFSSFFNIRSNLY